MSLLLLFTASNFVKSEVGLPQLNMLGLNYKKHFTLIFGYDSNLRYVVRQTYNKVKMS